MVIKAVRLVTIFVCGYLLIHWITIQHPFELTDFLIGLIANPVEFLFASFVLLLGGYLSGELVSQFFQFIKKNKIGNLRETAPALLEITGFLFLFTLLYQLGWEHTLIYFCISIFYAIIR